MQTAGVIQSSVITLRRPCGSTRGASGQKGLQQVSEFLDYFASLLPDRGQTHNAVEHGLAAQAGEAAIKVGQIEE
jgi:hypothetical protein